MKIRTKTSPEPTNDRRPTPVYLTPAPLTPANESFAHANHLTYFQSGSPFASVNASIASMNDSFPLAMQLTCIHQNKGVTRVTPVLTSLESITIPQ
jgi:hypothetical protein